MDTKTGLIGIAVGFVLYIIFTFFDIGNFSFLLPVFLFLAGIGIGYFIKEFKDSLIYGGIACLIGIAVFLVSNFGLSNNFNALKIILNAIGLFFGFGFGAIFYYRVTRKRKISEKISENKYKL